jgi:hypothetical protein
MRQALVRDYYTTESYIIFSILMSSNEKTQIRKL